MGGDRRYLGDVEMWDAVCFVGGSDRIIYANLFVYLFIYFDGENVRDVDLVKCTLFHHIANSKICGLNLSCLTKKLVLR